MLNHVADSIDLAGPDAAETRGIEGFADHVEDVAGSGEAQERMKVLAAAGLDGFETRRVVITIGAMILGPTTAGFSIGMNVRATLGHGIPPFVEMMCKGLKGKTVARMIQNEPGLSAVQPRG